MKYYYKIQRIGFNDEQFIPIDEEETLKAISVFMTGGKGTFKNGSISGNQIAGIFPDWHKAKGWNYGYKFLPEDWSEITPMGGRYERHYNALAGFVKTAIDNNQPNELLRPYEEVIAQLREERKKFGNPTGEVFKKLSIRHNQTSQP